ncbi:PREDICTED: spatacsin isoform X1 [Trachymyrmex cornetzi]|uniref:spatacsin isoform X1 n=1 Tax=Trachymyrmex cornetzi TaxID=471704 RepID=UPI00084F6259|nr:PREDICTED: spatacsin isoform X1 [Trachymyrmex cornetzi]
MSEKTTVGGIPVECLTGESAAIWSGWRTLGDRELVREASAKGTHIKLAHKCLAHRKNCSVEQACTYFNKEVDNWVDELLNKKQVHRASHVLKNMEKDPMEHIFVISIKSKDSFLRDYLCEYMININGFKNEHIAAWNIIKSIKQYEEKCKIQNELSSCICIDDIMKLPQNIEEALRTELYFSLNDPEILENVSNNILWDYLLSNNKINALKIWIDTKYNPDGSQISDKIDPHLKLLFTNLNITPDMVDYIDSSNAGDLVKNLAKNHFCRYGIFTIEEKNDLQLILNRSFGCGITLEELSTKILSLASSNINKTEFLQNIDYQLCLIDCSQNCDTQEDTLKLKKFFNVLTDMCNARNNYEDALIHGIVGSIDYLSDDFNDYLKTNYLVSLALIFLQSWQMQNALCHNTKSLEKNTLMRDIFTNKTVLKIDTRVISQEVLQCTLRHVPELQYIIEDQSKKDDITVYDLLDGYRNLNSKSAFKWRFKNELMPIFTNEKLVKTYGHQETLTYGYYLKEGRPNMAVYHLHAQAKLLGNVSSHRKFKAALYAHVLALRNLDKSDIVCSCIAFVELLKIDSNNLRLHVTVAKYVQEQLNISIGNLLENVVYKNQTDLKTVMLYLEQSFQKYLVDKTFDNAQFVETLKTWDIIVRFARVHNCVLPEILLKYLVDHDLWFEFVAVCDIFSYPKAQVLENTKLFNNASIREHLLTCLSNDKLSKSEPYNEKTKSQDPRQSSSRQHKKVGTKENKSPKSTSATSEIETDTISAKDVFNNCTSTSSDNNLWLTILNCHQSQDPPRALINASRSNLRPLLTVLATCYEPSSVVAYCYCWMVISTGREDIFHDYTECLEKQIWPSDKVSELLNKMVQYNYIKTINRAYKIFMPDSILNPFFEFLMQAISYGEFKENQQYLIEFKSQCSSLQTNKIVDWDSVHFTYLKNLYWVAVVATQCIVTALSYGFQSTFLRVKFLETLIKCNFSADLPVTVPDFQRLLDIMKILEKTDVKLNFRAVIPINNTYNFDTEIQRCINDLMAIENYSTALELACYTEFNSSEIILAQARNTFKQSINKDGEVNSAFWMQCAQNFNKYKVPPQVAVEFFVEHAEKVVSHKERYEVLKLAYETMKNAEIEQQTIDTLEMAMWKSCILAGPENIEFDNNDRIFNKLKTELLSGLDKLQVTCSLIDENEKSAAEILINKLIDLGKLDTALRISVIFHYNHKDLQILMLCSSLAEGEISPTDLTAQQKSLLEEKNQYKQQKYGFLRNRGLQKFSSSSSLNTISSIVEPSKTDDTTISNRHFQMECISILEKLSEILAHGKETCFRIVSCYKLAVLLGKTYQSLLILKDPIKFLQEIVESNIENKFETANDIIMSYKIKTANVATFLTENITMHINSAIEDGQEDLIFMWGYSLNSHFHLIMELCNDISLLGLKLLKTAQSLLEKYVNIHDEKKNVLGLKTIVELLIRSHDCFTASCNMEGIASILRKCQSLANMLQILKYWALLVRLVTGVGRFTEMNYVFQILKENDQFESLLGQGLDKVPGLKMALLEFLKRQCPEDKELFTLVALHFRLYYEIALMWENESKEIITKLISEILKECGKGITGIPVEIKFTRNDNVLKQLQLAVTNFTHATQYYLQDKKLNLASQCSHQAQLVALQIGLLNIVPQNQQAVCLLNLKSDELERILCHTLNFPQALIVIRAYNYHVDWVNLIYHHCILKGDTGYLKEFLTVINLTPMIVEDCARRYRLEKSINHSMTDNMKILISQISDVECKYMLASQLGFKDIVEEMLNDPMIGAYLKDTIWKKGYTAS